ncbi:hypothetical protein [Streptomyces roseolilacinus]|uniref:hypothetical protein n=1 Tax=Streptomyces roseolilacinus TaxID=66904 RepID=UPI0037F4DDF5
MPFEDELGEALRRVGDTFDTDRQEMLVMTATEQGRRSVRRRQALVVAASVVALGVLGMGAYASGVLPDLDRETSVADEKPVVGGERVFEVWETLAPEGTISRKQVLPRGPGEYVHVSFVYQDGKGGTGLVDFRMGLADPRHGKDGGRNVSHASHEERPATLRTKSYREQRITPEGHFVDLTVWNSPDPKSPTGTRPTPVLTGKVWQLVNANEWRRLLAPLPKPDPLFGEEPLDPAWVKPPATVSGPGMAATLRSLLPRGAFSALEGRGTDDARGPAASLLYDDGKGGAKVEVQLFRVDPDGYHTRQFTVCHNAARCTRTRLPDGSLVRTHDVRLYHPRQVKRQVTYLSPRGDMVEVTAWNAPDRKHEALRGEPPLTGEQMKGVAMSPQWRTALGALPAAPDEETGGPTRPWEWSEIMHRLHDEKKLVWNEDGVGAGLVEFSVDPDRRNTGDEPLLDVRQEQVDEGGEGVIRWTVTGALPGGPFATVTAYNAPAPDADATRTTPPVPLPMLKSFVLSPQWGRAR